MRPYLVLIKKVMILLMTFTPAFSYADLVPNGSEVFDSKTGLIWKRCSEGQTWNSTTCTGTATKFTHEEALKKAKTSPNTGVAWRLPNVKELASIADNTRSNPAIDPKAFPNTPSNDYWSSSADVVDSSFAWYVDFSSGYVNSSERSNYHHVRLVRASK